MKNFFYKNDFDEKKNIFKELDFEEKFNFKKHDFEEKIILKKQISKKILHTKITFWFILPRKMPKFWALRAILKSMILNKNLFLKSMILKKKILWKAWFSIKIFSSCQI